jgi:hypothetical protein
MSGSVLDTNISNCNRKNGLSKAMVQALEGPEVPKGTNNVT